MDRKALEAQFHSQRELDRNTMSESDFLKKYPNKGFYCITGQVEAFRDNVIKKKCKGAVILDYCCGLGQASRSLAQFKPKKIYGIDIADKEIETAKHLAEKNRLDNIEYLVMDAENMTFPDNSFDIVVCNGVLHHLDVERAYKEIYRVLKPKGIMVAHESLGYNPLISLYRRLTPKIRTAWETNHILTLKQVNMAKQYFQLDSIKFFYLASIAAIPLKDTRLFKPTLKILEAIDKLILKIPLIRLMAWQMVFVMKKTNMSV